MELFTRPFSIFNIFKFDQLDLNHKYDHQCIHFLKNLS